MSISAAIGDDTPGDHADTYRVQPEILIRDHRRAARKRYRVPAVAGVSEGAVRRQHGTHVIRPRTEAAEDVLADQRARAALAGVEHAVVVRVEIDGRVGRAFSRPGADSSVLVH